MSKSIATEKTKVSKAQIADVKFGKRTIQGLMLPSGEFAIAVSQINELMPDFASQSNEVRRVKSLLGNDSSPVKVKSEINSQPVNHQDAISRV